jgi:hypothetical protein
MRKITRPRPAGSVPGISALIHHRKTERTKAAIKQDMVLPWRSRIVVLELRRTG